MLTKQEFFNKVEKNIEFSNNIYRISFCKDVNCIECPIIDKCQNEWIKTLRSKDEFLIEQLKIYKTEILIEKLKL